MSRPVPPPPAGRGRWRKRAPWIVLVLFLPVAFLGLVTHANEYKSWGGGGVDCDGPFLLVLAEPAAIVYAILAVIFIRRALVRRSWMSGVAVVFCAALVAGLLGNIREARAELKDPGYREVCEGRS